MDWTVRIAFKKLYGRRFSRDVFPNLPKQKLFPNNPWKNAEKFFYKRLVSSGSRVSLIKWLHCGPFPGKLPTILEHSKGTFLLDSVFDDIVILWNCRLQAYKVRKKGQICKDFFGIFNFLQHSFLSEQFLKFLCSEVFKSIVGCRLYLCICI